MQNNRYDAPLLLRCIAVSVLFSTFLGSGVPVWDAVEAAYQRHECQSLTGEICHEGDCGTDQPRSSAHSCCQPFFGLLPSERVPTIPDYLTRVTFYSPTKLLTGRYERLFRPPRSFS